jgi:hypothetical protein
MLIATRVSFKPNFSSYSYRDEMVSDAIENCIRCVLNFDPERGENPFSYFTQVINFAFIRRIQKEKKQTLTKQRILAELPFDIYDIQEHCDGDEEYTNQFIEFLRENNAYGIPKDLEPKGRPKKDKGGDDKDDPHGALGGVLYDRDDDHGDDIEEEDGAVVMDPISPRMWEEDDE